MKKLTSKNVYDLLLEIENGFDVSLIKFFDDPVWPIVRSSLGQQLLNPPNCRVRYKKDRKRTLDSWHYLKLRIKKFRHIRRIEQVISEEGISLEECTYISRADEMKDKDGNSIIGKGFQHILEGVTASSVLSLDHPFFSELINSPGYFYFDPVIYSHVQGLEELQDFLEDRFPQHCIDFDQVAKYLAKVWSYKDIFEVIFRKSNCRFLFFTVFFHPISFAISLAANRCGIKSIEIQHGQQGKYSPLNLGMKANSVAEYKMLPNFFWAWGDKSKEVKIERSRYREGSVIVAGNPTYFLQKIDEPVMVGGLLIGLQKINPLLPDFVYDFLEEYSDKVVVRLHPHMDDLYESIKIQFLRFKNVEVQKSIQNELYDLLNSVSVVLTNFSSIALEAAAVGKIGIVVHENAFDLMEDNIRDGDIFKANNIEELRSISKRTITIESSFLERDILLVRERLAKFLCVQ